VNIDHNLAVIRGERDRIAAALAALRAARVLASVEEIAECTGMSPDAVRQLLPDPSGFNPAGTPLWDVSQLGSLLKQ
jgi:hypothetical protein